MTMTPTTTTTQRVSLPMYFPSGAFDLADVVTCANLVEVAYDQYCQWVAQGKPSDPTKFSWNPTWPDGFDAYQISSPLWGDSKMIFNHPEPFGFAVQDNTERMFLVFRGTESDADWYKDLDVTQTSYGLVTSTDFGEVHKGFYEVYSSMSPDVLAAVKQVAAGATSFFFTGHSLGSALITLAVPDVMNNSGIDFGSMSVIHYNFASPRVGDETFSIALNAMTDVPAFRIVNTEDVVPDVPFAVTDDVLHKYYYKHIGTPVDFTAEYDGIGNNHSMLNCYLYAVNNPSQPEGPISTVSTCQPSMPPGLLVKKV